MVRQHHAPTPPEGPADRRHLDPDRFILKCDAGLTALKYWLQKRRYNTYTWGRVDRYGNPMIGLSMEEDCKHDWGKWEKRGIIIVKDKSYVHQARALVEQHQSDGHLYDDEDDDDEALPDLNDGPDDDHWTVF